MKISELRASIGETDILKSLNLEIKEGETHAIMGPNGAGKSTLANVLAGREEYEVKGGSVEFEGVDLLELSPEERAAAGVFLAFQYPVEIPGVPVTTFLRHALNALARERGEKELDTMGFAKLIRGSAKELGIKADMLKRMLNVGFSGGEKKRLEVLQMTVLKPKFMVLDETDSGLDIDALRVVANGVNNLRDDKRSFLVITHYQRLLEYIKPDFVHILADGEIVKTGGAELALELEEKGYTAFVKNEEAA